MFKGGWQLQRKMTTDRKQKMYIRIVNYRKNGALKGLSFIQKRENTSEKAD